MGYWNDIAFALDETATKDMQAAMAQNGGLESIIEIDCNAVIRQGCMGGQCDSIKWDNVSDDGVKAFETVLSETEGDYYFIRIGENVNDIEVRGDFKDNPFKIGVARMFLSL